MLSLARKIYIFDADFLHVYNIAHKVVINFELLKWWTRVPHPSFEEKTAKNKNQKRNGAEPSCFRSNANRAFEEKTA